MKKKIYTRLAAGLLCAALLFTDAASLNVWAVSNDLNEGQITSLADPGEESDTTVIIEEEEEKKEMETVPVKETEETDENDASAIEDDDEAALPVEEEQESVSENTAEEETANSVMAASEGIIASGESNNISWIIDADGKLTVSGTGDFEKRDIGFGNLAPWYDNNESIKTAVVDVIGMTDASRMFFGCGNLTVIDLTNFDTSSVMNMNGMFLGCRNLTTLDLDNFNTDSVTDMSDMFSGCSNLTTLDLDNFNTGNVTDMSYMFSQCSNLITLDLGNFNTGSVMNMWGMFSECSNLTTLNLSNFNTDSVTSMQDMFYQCGNLATLDLSHFDTYSVMSMSRMFADCGKLTMLDLGHFNTSNVKDMWRMFFNCSSLTTLNVSNFNTGKVTGMGGMFSGCSNLTALNVSNFNTGSATDMGDMFSDCASLTTLDVSNFNTSSVYYDISGMFSGCSNLTVLDVSNFDTGRVKNMSRMFFGCANLVTLDVSNFDTSNVETISKMFSGCASLNMLDVSHFDTRKVMDMSEMFKGCANLTSLDLSSFDTQKAVVYNMFSGCTGLTCIYTPCNLTKYVLLPSDSGDIWYRSDGTEVTELPKNLDYSVALGKNYIPTEKEPGEDEPVKPVNNVSWNIDANGKLTVTGTGNFERLGGEPPWINYQDSIRTAEVDVQGMTDASRMFVGCSNLTSIDLRNFDTSKVTDMAYMFSHCRSLTTLDVSHFDTSKVTDMSYMFYTCNSLTTLDVSHFDTSKVTNMNSMFASCDKLTTLDVSHFDTSKVTDMSSMFAGCDKLATIDLSSFNTSKVTSMSMMFFGCENLTTLDLSSFNTANVTNMSYMFDGCKNLTALDLINFNTSNVTRMGYMFWGCEKLTTLDLSHLDTSKVTNMEWMFGHCKNLTTLDVSNFDTGKVTVMSYMFSNCNKLTTLDVSSFDTRRVEHATDMLEYNSYYGTCSLTNIYTPRNLTQSVSLPANAGDVWYRSDGTVVTELPQNLSYSILITKNKKPEVSEPHITAVKKKTAYVCGETVNTDDITVTYFDDKGAITKLTEGFTTNVDEVNRTMSTPGNKTLIVTYVDSSVSPGREFTAEIELTVTLGLTEANAVITLLDIQAEHNPVYNGSQHTPRVEVKLTQDDTVLAAGTDYTVSYQNNINAGTAAAVVTGMGVYSGTLEKIFTIDKAKVKIRVKDTTIAVDDAIPETFACEMTGFFNRDEEKVTVLSFSFTKEDGTSVSKDNINTSKTGTYTVTPTEATVGNNYVVDIENGYQPGTLTIAEERVVYTVTFDMMGHGTDTAPDPIKSVRSGRLIKEPAAPTAEGYAFKGWYKDIACTKAWDFAVDTVLADTTLYARWVVQIATGGIQIQEIPEQYYTGNAIKPVPAVYASDGTLLKAGKDYTVKYVNNINADQVTADGGTYNSLDVKESGFNADLPYVEIKGKGNHTGTVYTNFHIRQAAISDAGGNAATGFTLKYSDQLVTNAKNVQKPFSSLKYKKAMTAGKDYTVTYSSDNVFDADGNAVKAEDGGKWTVTGTYDKNNKYTPPAIPKGYSGIFEMTVDGIGNYTGRITQKVYVTDKANLIKNVTVALGKNQKNMPYNEGRAVTLTPGFSDGKKYYKVNSDGTVSSTPEANANDLFTVKSGKTFLVWGQDYTVTYTDNRAVGTAAMTITGIGNYRGSKSVTFKITGTAFKANTIDVKAYNAQTNPNDNDFKTYMPYTGSAVTQNKVTLTTKVTKANPVAKTLRYGEHYTISYKNNIKKGTATMTFTAKPESGYSGSFNKTFKIGAVSLADPAFVKAEAAKAAGQEADSLTSGKDDKGNAFYQLNGTVTYTREGAKPSQRIRLTLCDGNGNPTDVVLKEGTDYTVSYANNTVLKTANPTNKIPTMTFKGKGNYTGNLKVTFEISEAAMESGADNLTVSAAATAYDSKKASAYQYAPKVTVKDGKKVLGKKDYTVQYEKCTQEDVVAYLAALEDSNATWETVLAKRPYAVIKASAGSGYATKTGKEIKVYLDFYRTKLTGSNLYIIVSEGETLNIYSGQQVIPNQVTVYYSADAKAIAAAKKAKETDADKLTSSSGSYKLTRLTPQTEVNGTGDYTLTYGANVTAGKNKGTVTVTGTGMYGGSVTAKFTILQRDVYTAP